MTIVPYLQGGLGNQCFIYATARSLADRISADLVLDLSYLAADVTFKRTFLLSAFSIRTNRICEGAPLWTTKMLRLKYKVLSRCCERFGSYYCEKPHSRRYQPLNLEDCSSERVCLDGYWQSEKYFSQNRAQIACDLTLKDEKCVAGLAVEGQMHNARCPVFVHIRSYKEVSGREDGSAALPVSYFQNALAKMKSLAGSFQLFVFSDDVQWAKSRLPVPAGVDTVYVEPSGNGQEFDTLRDFCLMRKCRHGIVANSSFSWWAGWLGEQDWAAKGEKPIRIRVGQRCMNDDYWPDRWLAVSRD